MVVYSFLEILSDCQDRLTQIHYSVAYPKRLFMGIQDCSLGYSLMV